MAGEECTDVMLHNYYEKLTCTLPTGTGSVVPVIVYTKVALSETLESNPKMLLGYAQPQVTLVAHTECLSSISGGSIYSCPRDGGGTLTIFGTNFGADDALVLIGGELCSNLAHDEDTPHSRVTCTLPLGTAANAEVVFIQSGGAIAPITNSSITVK